MKKLAIGLLILFSTTTFGALRTAVTSGDWNTSSTWSPSSVPNTSDSVLIPAGKVITNVANASCGTITINGVLRNGGTLTVKGFFVVNGTFNPSIGTVVFTGSAVQKILGSSTISFYHITNKNNINLAMSIGIDVYGTYTMANNSVFNTNSYRFTLKSTSPTQTGRIGSLPVSYTFTGNITQERYVKGAGWHMLGTTISTPLISAVLYDETVHGNLNVGYTMGALVPGIGGFIQTTNDTIMSADGPFTRGTKTCMLDFSGFDMANDGWNLIANPYPSEINIDSPSFMMSGTTNMVYVWDWTTQSYLWWKKGSGGTYQSSIAQGQAFWVQAINNTAYVKMGENAKTTTSDPFYKTYTNNTLYPAVKITLNADDHNAAVYTTIGDYMDMYDPNTDGQYLESQTTLKSEIYTKSSDGYRLVYDCRDAKDTIAIPLYIKPHTLNPHTLSLEGLSAVTQDYRWLIYNNRTGQIITSTTITFTPTSLDEKNTYTLYLIKNRVVGSDIVNGIIRPQNTVMENVIQVIDQSGRSLDTHTQLTAGIYIIVYESPAGVFTRKRLVINQ